jgi:hypothetical protein
MSCPYRHILGKEGEGVHSYRIFDIAIIDVIFTIIGAFIISYIFNYNFFIVLICLFILGIILHRIFCVNTTINKLIFGIIS